MFFPAHDQINKRPRKTLLYQTPAGKFETCVEPAVETVRCRSTNGRLYLTGYPCDFDISPRNALSRISLSSLKNASFYCVWSLRGRSPSAPSCSYPFVEMPVIHSGGCIRTAVRPLRQQSVGGFSVSSQGDRGLQLLERAF